MTEKEEGKMTWDHRILRHKYHSSSINKGFWYGIHEVYYKDGIPDSATNDPTPLTSEDDTEAESLEALRWSYNMIERAFEKPILDAESLEEISGQ